MEWLNNAVEQTRLGKEPLFAAPPGLVQEALAGSLLTEKK